MKYIKKGSCVKKYITAVLFCFVTLLSLASDQGEKQVRICHECIKRQEDSRKHVSIQQPQSSLLRQSLRVCHDFCDICVDQMCDACCDRCCLDCCLPLIEKTYDMYCRKKKQKAELHPQQITNKKMK